MSKIYKNKNKENKRIDFESFGSKIPPYSPEAEMSVIGSLMLDNNTLNRIYNIITEESFYSESNRKIYKAIIELSKENKPFDIVLLSEKLIELGFLKDIGGTAYLSDINRKTPTAANVEHYAMIVQERYLKRKLITTGGKIMQSAFDESTDAFEELENAETQINDLTQNLANKKDADTIKNIAIQIYKKFEKREKPKIHLLTQWDEYNELTGGILSGDLIVIAAASSVGKSALKQSLQRYWMSQKKKGISFNIEMTNEQETSRIITMDSGIESYKFRWIDKFTDNDLIKLAKQISKYYEVDLYLYDVPLNINQLRAIAKMYCELYKIDYITVDYIQLMTPLNDKDTQERQISQISNGLKRLAKELQIPVIALAQLNRELFNRPEKRPRLSDLRYSGAIEQDSDVVMFVYRPYYHLTDKEQEMRDKIDLIEHDVELIIAKDRHGGIGTIITNFDKKKYLFYPLNEYKEKSLF